jgi:type II secretory pathway predicted ATPase ExeA
MMVARNAMEMFNWRSNPFTFDVIPEIFVGNIHEVNKILDSINNGSKLSMVIGSTGSGKTTLLKSIEKRYSGDGFRHVIYASKPPKNPDDWLKVFGKFTGNGGLLSKFSRKEEVSLYNLGEVIKKKLADDKCLLLVDECHEASMDSLEWLRVMTDQVGGIVTVIAALPVLETSLKEKLETLLRRVSTRIELTNLSKSETRELVKRRIESLGGDDIRPFTQDAMDLIYERTGGYPREILRICNDAVGDAFRKGISTIDRDFLQEAEGPKAKVSVEKVSELPEKQRMLLEVLSKQGDLTPSELAQSAGDEYKDSDNAVRAVNNILNRLMKEGMVERRRVGSTFRYKVSPKVASLMVQA